MTKIKRRLLCPRNVSFRRFRYRRNEHARNVRAHFPPNFASQSRRHTHTQLICDLHHNNGTTMSMSADDGDDNNNTTNVYLFSSSGAFSHFHTMSDWWSSSFLKIIIKWHGHESDESHDFSHLDSLNPATRTSSKEHPFTFVWDTISHIILIFCVSFHRPDRCHPVNRIDIIRGR